MLALTQGRARQARLRVLLVAAALAGGGVAGIVIADDLGLGVAFLVVVIVLAIAAWRPVAIGALALAGSFATHRVGAGAINLGAKGGLSYTDALLAIALVPALPAVIDKPALRRLRGPAVGLGIYLAALLPTIALNGSLSADAEWIHRFVLVGGAMVVGAWIAQTRSIALALRALCFIAAVVAVAAILDSARRGFAPAFPLGLNKNLIGALFGAVILIVLTARRFIAISAPTQVMLALLLAAGLLASQSRGGMLAGVSGLFVVLVLDPRSHSRQARAFAILVGLAIALFAAVSIHAQLIETQTGKFNHSSLATRFNVEREARHIWRTSPVDGVGLKYFSSGEFGPLAQPANNDIDNELAESGLIGLAGFVAFQVIVLVSGVRRRREHPLIPVGIGLVFGQLMHGMVDIYWTAAVVSLPFIVLGMALGSDPYELEEPREEQPRRRQLVRPAAART